MSMTRKDYQLIADVLRAEYVDADGGVPEMVVERIAERLATALKDDNPHFDQNHFLVAALGWSPLSMREAK